MAKKLGFMGGGLILLLIIAFGIGYYYFIHLPLPKTEGELRVEGLHNRVKVYRDSWGIPHIYAQDEHDLFLAQGFVQAQDRLWQMEADRRLASGRLGEILGPEALPVDRFMRTLGLMRAARREVASYGPDATELLQAFSDGVNAFIDSRQGRLPLEFRLLHLNPEPWHPEDSLAWGKVMAFLGGKNWQEEMVKAMLKQKLGQEKARALLHLNQPDTPTIFPQGLDLAAFFPLTNPPNSDYLPYPGGVASNNWVIRGSRSVTGSPLLANDMHLGLRVPSIWYEMHLVGGDFDVTGLSMAGIPLIIAGHNNHGAWGITFAYTDVQDVYLERLKPDGSPRYLYKGKWVKAEVLEESIQVKGRDKPVLHKVWKTRHGPIISPHLTGKQQIRHGLSLKWSAYEPGGMVPVLQRLNLSRNWKEFKEAAQKWPEPAMNLVYADREGNVGYVLASRIPVRSQGHGCGPFKGWSGENEWVGYMDSGKKPSVSNPADGFLYTANNRISEDNSPYLGVDYAPGFRAARTKKFLSGKNTFSKKDFRDLQGDLECLPAREFIAALEEIKPESPHARALLRKLRGWDQIMDPDSVGAAIYSVLFYRLLENTFRDELGEVANRFFGVGLTPLKGLNRFVTHSRVILHRLMADSRSPWFDDATTPEREDLAYMVEKSLEETDSFLREELGPDQSKWRWGRLHRIVMKHPLGRVKPLDKIFNIGPYEGGGHFCTVCQSAVKPGMEFDLNGWAVSNRHIYDLKDWNKSLGNIVPGQSGVWGSSHYKDQVDLWLRVGHHPLYYSRKTVESMASSILVLKPSRLNKGS